MVVGDEAVSGMIDTFTTEQGVGGDAAEDLENDTLCEAGHCVRPARSLLHFVEPAIVSVQ
jgi:hypothetical protein